jgi:hypothetical protein
MSELKLPCFKDVELDDPTAVALGRQQCEKNCYHVPLIPTLFKVNSHPTTLQSVNLLHCLPLLNAVTAEFNHKFADFLKTEPRGQHGRFNNNDSFLFQATLIATLLSNQRSRLSLCQYCQEHVSRRI